MQRALRNITVYLLLALCAGVSADDASGPPIAALIAEGEQQMQQQDIAGAIETLRRAVAADPNSSLAHTRLGGAYLLNSQYDPAIEQFQRAISADATNADAFIGMAVAYLHSGRMGLAKAALEEAKRVDPSKGERIDQVMDWIDQRAEGTAASGQ